MKQTNYAGPYLPVPEDIIPKMLTLASVAPGELVFYLGSADVLALYLSSYTLNLLSPKFMGEPRPGA